MVQFFTSIGFKDQSEAFREQVKIPIHDLLRLKKESILWETKLKELEGGEYFPESLLWEKGKCVFSPR